MFTYQVHIQTLQLSKRTRINLQSLEKVWRLNSICPVLSSKYHPNKFRKSSDTVPTQFRHIFGTKFQKCSENVPKMIRKWSENDPRMIRVLDSRRTAVSLRLERLYTTSRLDPFSVQSHKNKCCSNILPGWRPFSNTTPFSVCVLSWINLPYPT